MSDNPEGQVPAKRPAVCVFCGSSHGRDAAYAAAARRLGTLIGENGYALVFGGGNIGLMGEVARAAREAGAPVMGVLPDFLKHLESPLGLNERVVFTADLQSRKTLMMSLSDAFIVLPGGLGTLDEYFEVITSAQLRVLAKPIVVVDVAGYFAPLKALLDRTRDEGFVQASALALQHFVSSVGEAIETVNRLLGHAPAA